MERHKHFVVIPNPGKVEDVAAALIRLAEIDHEAYPQYRGYWDEWTVGIVRTNIKTKAGLAFAKGDVVLVKPIIEDLSHVSFARRKDKRGVIAYSSRTRVNTGIWLSDIKVDATGWRTVVAE